MTDNDGNEINVGDIVEIIATGHRTKVLEVCENAVSTKAENVSIYFGNEIRKSSGVPDRIDTLKDRIRELEAEVERLRCRINGLESDLEEQMLIEREAEERNG